MGRNNATLKMWQAREEEGEGEGRGARGRENLHSPLVLSSLPSLLSLLLEGQTAFQPQCTPTATVQGGRRAGGKMRDTPSIVARRRVGYSADQRAANRLSGQRPAPVGPKRPMGWSSASATPVRNGTKTPPAAASPTGRRWRCPTRGATVAFPAAAGAIRPAKDRKTPAACPRGE